MIKNLETIFYIFLYLELAFLLLYLIAYIANLLKIVNYLYLD